MKAELQFVSGEAAALAWEEYVASGLPDHIGSMHLCLIVNALHKCGLAQIFLGADTFVPDEVIGTNDPKLVGMVLNYLKTRSIIQEIKCGVYRVTEVGSRLFCEVGRAQLQFYVDAYGPVTTRLAELLQKIDVYGGDIIRNGRSLGASCDTLFSIFHTPIIKRIIEDVNPTRIVDLGCGGGRLLVDACSNFPALQGLGIDISQGAIDLARSEAESRGLSGRLQFVVADAFQPETWPEEARNGDMICAIGALHEHFRHGETAVIEILNVYADLISRCGARVMVVGEPELLYDNQENDADLHLVHIFTAQGFPKPRQQWLELFSKSRLKCKRIYSRQRIGPRFCFYVLILR